MNGSDSDRDLSNEEAKVFLSYSRKDRETAQAIAEVLRTRQFGVFKDTDDILPTEEWKERLEQLIEEADTIVFLLSPHSAVSEVCAWEVEYATELNKRIAPIVIHDVEGSDIPPLLSRLNFIFCTPRDPFENAIDTLCSALSTDIEWIREHTRIGVLAKRWKDAGKPARLLPRGQDIEDSEHWRDERPPETPEVTPLQAEYIAEARRAAGRRMRNWFLGVGVTVVVTAVLAIVAYLQSIEADRQRVIAEANAEEAAAQRDEAEIQRAQAVRERNAALLNESRFLAGMSGRMLEQGRAAEALELAYEALPHDLETPERPVSSDAMRALREARLNLREVARLDGQEQILSAVYSPNGAGIATADAQGRIVVRDANSGALISNIEGHDGGVTAMAIASNNAVLFSGGMDWTPRLWNAVTGEKLTDVFGMQSVVGSVAISDDLKHIAAAGFDGSVMLWAIGTGQQVGAMENLPDAVSRLAFSSDGSVLVAHGGDRVRIWDVETGNEIATFGGGADPSSSFALRPFNAEIAIGKQNGDIELRSTRDGAVISDIAGVFGTPVMRLEYSPQGWTLAASDLIASYAALFRAGVQISALLGHEERLNDIAFSADGEHLITGSEDGTARIWEAESGRPIAVLGGHEDGVNQVGFNPAAAGAYSISGGGVMRLWSGVDPIVGARADFTDWNAVAVGFGGDDTATVVLRNSAVQMHEDGNILTELEHGLDAEVASLSESASRFAVGNSAGDVGLFDLSTGQEILRTSVGSSVAAIALSSDAGALAIGTDSGQVLRWAMDGEVPETLTQLDDPILAIGIDGRDVGVLTKSRFVVLGPDRTVETEIRTQMIRPTAAIAPDLSFTARAEQGGQVVLHSTESGDERVLQTGYLAVEAIGFSEDGTRLFVTSADTGMMIVDAETGSLFARIPGHTDRILSADTNNDRLIAGAADGTVLIRPLFGDPKIAVKQAGDLVDALSPLSPTARCRFFLDAEDVCAAARP